MERDGFDEIFAALTGNPPFPWQRALYKRLISDRSDNIPASCNLPTGLGKTSVIAIWLIALATHPHKMPRRLVYVVNRRTVVDQTTDEAEKLRANAEKAGVPIPVISTLRGQFADNREWSADPSRPAIICGTVDMIGSRMLFSGYGVGRNAKPLHAGFLGQDLLLVHDEAHLEPAFQELLIAIEKEQATDERSHDFGVPKLRVMELSATPRGSEEPFELTKEEKEPPLEIPSEAKKPIDHVWRRTHSRKSLNPHPIADEKKELVAKVIELALNYKDTESKPAVLVFMRTVEAVGEVVNGLKKAKVADENILTLTGTMRGLERDLMANTNTVFARFKRDTSVAKQPGTVYMVCTSAGEVGVDISADHLVCDLSTLDSMAQRFGRVNRYGDGNATVDFVHPTTFDTKDKPFEAARERTHRLLGNLRKRPDGILDACPAAMGELIERTIREGDGAGTPPLDRKEALRKFILPAFAPTPTILPTSDILFDSRALTTIREKLPGRPPVEPYLHGVGGWEPPETHVAWRKEVGIIKGDLLEEYEPADLLENYPLRPHELLRDNSNRVFDRLTKLFDRLKKLDVETPVWIVSNGDAVDVSTLGKIIEGDKEDLYHQTLLLPPEAGGLSEEGMLDPASGTASDVSDEWYADKERKVKLRTRIWDDTEPPPGMRRSMPVIDTRPDADESEEKATGKRFWHWYELPKFVGEGKASASEPYELQPHLNDAKEAATAIVDGLKLAKPLRSAIIVAAMFHDLGKNRTLWQRSIGNPDPTKPLAKSGGKMRPRDLNKYRHEYGSLRDVTERDEFKNLDPEMQELALHLIAAHHGRARPHFSPDEAFDPEHKRTNAVDPASKIPRRFAKLQRKYGRWGLAYLESLVRAADILASQKAEKGGEA